MIFWIHEGCKDCKVGSQVVRLTFQVGRGTLNRSQEGEVVARLGLEPHGGGCKVVSCKVGSRGTPLGESTECGASCLQPSHDEGWQ